MIGVPIFFAIRAAVRAEKLPDGIEVMIELTEERQDFSEEIKLEEIDLRIAMKVREILEEKENIKQ